MFNFSYCPLLLMIIKPLDYFSHFPTLVGYLHRGNLSPKHNSFLSGYFHVSVKNTCLKQK